MPMRGTPTLSPASMPRVSGGPKTALVPQPMPVFRLPSLLVGSGSKSAPGTPGVFAAMASHRLFLRGRGGVDQHQRLDHAEGGVERLPLLLTVGEQVAAQVEVAVDGDGTDL